jgi:hypothetical protein
MAWTDDAVTTPAPADRASRLPELAKWHEQWVLEQVAAGVDGPVPDDRPEGSDYNLHVPDIEASGSELDRFHERARQIMGIAGD